MCSARASKVFYVPLPMGNKSTMLLTTRFLRAIKTLGVDTTATTEFSSVSASSCLARSIAVSSEYYRVLFLGDVSDLH